LIEQEPDVAVLPDVLTHGLRIVFCGTAASNVSAAVGAYYAGPGNAFWPTLHRIGLTPRQLAPAEFRLLPTFGLGLTDLAKHESGVDVELTGSAFDPDGLRAKIAQYAPGVLAFTSKRAAREFMGRPVAYGWQPAAIGATRCYVLPSPSGAARRYWDIRLWQALADGVRQQECEDRT
jgi:TDG/mug DNA glycosylase family protein